MKKGVSPVIATVLLVGMVVVIGLIIFLWFRGMVGETVTKFSGTNIQLVCGDVQFDVSHSGGAVFISNIGNVPIFDMKVKISGSGSYSTKSLSKDFPNANWLSTGLNQGGTFSGSLGLGDDVEKITLIPVLIGTSDKGKKTYVCEDQYGLEVEI